MHAGTHTRGHTHTGTHTREPCCTWYQNEPWKKLDTLAIVGSKGEEQVGWAGVRVCFSFLFLFVRMPFFVCSSVRVSVSLSCICVSLLVYLHMLASFLECECVCIYIVVCQLCVCVFEHQYVWNCKYFCMCIYECTDSLLTSASVLNDYWYRYCIYLNECK